MFFVCVNSEASLNEFVLVAASIRDEYFSRATRHLHFWEEDRQIIGGMIKILFLLPQPPV
jgi:uncharacterized protein with NRDE domain